MSHPRVTPIGVGRESVLVAFARLLAPRPHVYVFPDLKGWQFATVEMPNTYQVYLGVSAELFHYIDSYMRCESNVDLTEHVEVKHVQGHRMQFYSAPPLLNLTEFGDEPMVPPTCILLEPKPMLGAPPETP